MYITVGHLKSLSGFTWDDAKGLYIDVATDDAWKEYIKVCQSLSLSLTFY